jgi:hypothetical protein
MDVLALEWCRTNALGWDVFFWMIGVDQNHGKHNSNSNNEKQNNNNKAKSLTRGIGPALLALGPLMHV